MDFYAYRYVNTYGISQAVPLDGTISYSDLASKTGTDVGQLKQMLRHLMIIHVFAEPELNHVTHSAASKALLEPTIRAFNEWIVLDEFDFVAKGIEAIQKWGHGAQEPTHASLQLGYGTDLSMFQAFEERPDSRKRFAAIMTSVSQSSVYSADHLIDYDWSSLGEGTVVDVGGSRGHCCLLVARASPNLKFIVQDLPQIIEQAKNPATTLIPEDLRDRIEFVAHDFYKPNPVRGAAVYFLRTIVHMLPDEKAIKVLKNLVDAMNPSSRLVIMDQVMPPVGSAPVVIERAMRAQDLNMMCLSNARERDLGQWLALFAAADPRLTITKTISPPGRVHSIIEVSLVDPIVAGV